MAVDAGLSERKLIILKSDHPELPRDRRTGWLANPFKIHGAELKFRDDPQ